MNNREESDQTLTVSATPEQMSSDENANPTRRGVAKYGRGAKAWISEESLRRKLERRKQFTNSSQPAKQDFAAEHSVPFESETNSPAMDYITIDDIPFQVTAGGSKLLRTTGRPEYDTRSVEDRLKISLDISASGKATPKEAVVSGVTFKRTKNSNLIRSGFAHLGFVAKSGPRSTNADEADTDSPTEMGRQNSADDTRRLVPFPLSPDDFFPQMLLVFSSTA
jgi:hypothetical protein